MSPYRSMMFTWLLVASVALAALMLGAAVWYGPRIVAGADTTKAVKLNGDLQACRSALNAELVVIPNIDVDTATAHVSALTNEIVEANFNHDLADVARLLPLLAPARADLNAAVDTRDQKVRHYQELISASRTDPGAFLETCHREAP